MIIYCVRGVGAAELRPTVRACRSNGVQQGDRGEVVARGLSYVASYSRHMMLEEIVAGGVSMPRV